MNINDARYIANKTCAAGGGTWNLLGEAINLTEGYVVGGIVPSKVLEYRDGSVWDCAREIISFAEENASIFEQYKNVFLGTWYNNGKIHLDVVENLFYDVDICLRTAKALGEQSIYDCVNSREIFV